MNLSGNVDKWLTGLTMVGLIGFFVYNAKAVIALTDGFEKDAVAYVVGIRGTAAPGNPGQTAGQ